MGIPDYAILLIYIAVLIGIGWHFRSSGESGTSFFLAGRSMGYFPIGLSVMVTTFSALNYLAFPGEVFAHGLYVLISLPVFFIAALPIVFIWMPFFHRMRLVSVYEYLERRFDWRVRALASGLFICWRLFWMAAALFASARILAVLTGIPLIPVILVCGITAVLYTSEGGMKAVMWTDVLQFFVLFGGIVLGVYCSGGREIFQLAAEGKRFAPWYPFESSYFSFDPSIRISFWSGLLGTFVAFLSRYGADQMVIQRYFSARNLRSAQRGLWLNATVSVISLGLLVIFGLAVYAHAVRCGILPGPGAAGKPQTVLHAISAVMRDFPPGAAGLIAAGLMAATMSSIDSGLNSCCTAYLIDFHPHLFKKPLSARILTMAVGLAVTGGAVILVPLTAERHTLFALINKFINAMGSPLLGIMLLAMFNRKVNASGMLAGGLLGFLCSLLVSFTVETLALHYYAVVNLSVTVILCLICSRFSHDAATEENLRWCWRKNND